MIISCQIITSINPSGHGKINTPKPNKQHKGLFLCNLTGDNIFDISPLKGALVHYSAVGNRNAYFGNS